MADGCYLPKGRLAHTGRAEDFSDLAAYNTARNSLAGQPMRRESVVELGKTGGDGARALAAVERLEGL